MRLTVKRRWSEGDEKRTDEIKFNQVWIFVMMKLQSNITGKWFQIQKSPMT